MSGLIVLMAVLVLIALVAMGVALARSGRKQYDAQAEVIPGQKSGAPPEWAGAHTPEARLHRRLGELVRDLRAASDVGAEDADALERRVELEQQAVALDQRLIQVAGRPLKRGAGADMGAVEAREAAVADIATQVAELETLAAAHTAGVGPTGGALDRVRQEVADALREAESAGTEADDDSG